MNKNRMLQALALAVLLTGSVFLCAEIPLRQAVETGVREDAQYQNHLSDMDISRLNQVKARLNKRFNLDFSGSYLFKSQQMEIGFLPGQSFTAGSRHNYDLKLALTQPFYTGGMLSSGVKLERQNEAVVRLRSELRALQVAGRIKLSYFTYRLLESKKKSLSLLVENLELHLERIQAFYREELVKKSDILETELKIAEAKLTLADLARAMEEENILFKRLCTLEISGIEPDYREAVGTEAEMLAYFSAHHPALRVLSESAEGLRIRKRLNAGAYLPQVFGFAQLHYGKPGIDFFKDSWSFYFQGGVSINLKVFDWSRLKKDQAVTDHSLRQLENRKAALLADARKGLGQLYARKRAIESQVGLLGRMAALAAEDARLKEQLYKENQAANIDYLSALLNKEKYESQRSERKVELQMVNININTLVGRNGLRGPEK